MANVYQIRNIVNDHIYIGGSVNFKGRKSNHLYSLRKNTHNYKIQLEYNLFGEECFVFEILQESAKENIREIEQKYIDELKPFYNISPSSTTNFGVKRSIESRNRLRGNTNKKGKKLSAGSRKNISEAIKKAFTPERRLLQSQKQKGNTYRRGSNHTKEAILALSGENSIKSKLTSKEVAEIREKYIPRSYSSYMLAKEYGVRRQQINRIIHKENWKYE